MRTTEAATTSDELRQATFEAVVPMATTLVGLFVAFATYNAMRLGDAMTAGLYVSHAVAIAVFAAVAVGARRWRDIAARFANPIGCVLAATVTTVCVHLQLVTGDALYVTFIGTAVIAECALVLSTTWAVGIALACGAAAVIATPSPAAIGDTIFVLVSAVAIGLAIHVARCKTHLRVIALRRIEARAATERIDSMARMSGGLGHDFNNILSVILADAELIADPLSTPEERDDSAAGIQEAAMRGAAIARQLLAFSRRQTIARTRVRPVDELRGLERMVSRAVGTGVRVAVGGAAQAEIEVDAGQLGQAILNLAVNARDAMPGGGDIHIHADDIVVDDAIRSRHPDAAPGRHVAIAVEDSGTGMDDATLSRVFEPFFTTKAAGKGTGLGMAMVHGIVRQHGGFVDVKSAIGVGTTVTLYLPAAA
jgi:signal transduction histidine kinase